MSVRKTILDCTDLVFYLSNFMNDSSAKEFFNTQRLYRGMLERFPGRYKKKKSECFKKIEELLEKHEGRIWHVSSQKTVIFICMAIRGFNCNCIVSYKGGEVIIKIDQCMLHLLDPNDDNDMSNYEHDPELIGAFKNFFEC